MSAAQGRTRQNLFGFGRKPAPAPVKRKRGGLTLSEAGSAAFKAGKKSRDLSDFDTWLVRKHLETRSDGFIDRVRDDYKRGVARADADEENREFLKQKREQARETARDRKEQARDAKVSGKRAAPGASSYPDEAALQAGFKRGLTLREMLASNPLLRKSRAANPAKFDRCVKAVQKRGGDVNAYAVCKSALKGNPVKRYSCSACAGKKKRCEKCRERAARDAVRAREARERGNPAAASAEVFEEFHGYAPTEVIKVSKERHHHEWVASAGDLVGLQVKPINGGEKRKIEGLGECFLAFNEAKNQLFIEGGDQRMSPAELKKFGITAEHELHTLGKLVGVGYFTEKTHLGDEGGEAVYTHTFRSTNENGKHVIVKIARYPDLIYRVMDEQFEVSGGSYEILREGINK